VAKKNPRRPRVIRRMGHRVQTGKKWGGGKKYVGNSVQNGQGNEKIKRSEVGGSEVQIKQRGTEGGIQLQKKQRGNKCLKCANAGREEQPQANKKRNECQGKKSGGRELEPIRTGRKELMPKKQKKTKGNRKPHKKDEIGRGQRGQGGLSHKRKRCGERGTSMSKEKVTRWKNLGPEKGFRNRKNKKLRTQVRRSQQA